MKDFVIIYQFQNKIINSLYLNLNLNKFFHLINSLCLSILHILKPGEFDINPS